MPIIPRQLYKQIEWHFFNIDKTKAQIAQYNDDTIAQAYQSIKDMRAVGHGVGSHSDPTARLGLRLVEGPESIERLRKWAWVVDKVTAFYEHDTDCSKLIRLHYKVYAGRNVSHAYEELNVDRRTFYRMKEEIVYTAALAATQRGLIEVFF